LLSKVPKLDEERAKRNEGIGIRRKIEGRGERKGKEGERKGIDAEE